MKEREVILAHKKGFTILICISLVFFGCFVFPVLNITKDFPKNISLLNILIACGAYFYIGNIQGLLFGHKAMGKILGISSVLTLVGFACRFLMEYGEVSNTYNFTIPNIAVHLFVTLAVVFVAAASTREKK